MQVIDLRLQGIKKISPKVFYDERGFFYESYRKPLYAEKGIAYDFAQDNHSYSKQGTLRGMHFQTHPGQAKLIMVVSGSIFDVFVDIRKDSPTFGEWDSIVLEAEAREQLLIPEGFAHGFYVLSDQAHVVYKVSSVYVPETEKTFRFDDPQVGIRWPEGKKLLSKKDAEAPFLKKSLYEIVDSGSGGTFGSRGAQDLCGEGDCLRGDDKERGRY